MQDISASVGRGGANRRQDVLIVQRLLDARGFPAGAADGVYGPRTRDAILAFQRTFMPEPDGRIDPGGATIKRLNRKIPVTRLIPMPDRSTTNRGVSPVNNVLMAELFGNPRRSYTANCQPVTQAKLKRNIITKSVGPFRATGLKPALESLTAIMAEVQRERPEVYAALGTAGMLCCRWVRGSTTSISNHAWGTAIDLRLNDVIDPRGDDRVQYGLTLIAPIFNRFGWYWGAAFPTEDAMHFEAGRALVESWRLL